VKAIPKLVAAGQLRAERIALSFRRLMRQRIRLGMLDPPTSVEYNRLRFGATLVRQTVASKQTKTPMCRQMTSRPRAPLRLAGVCQPYAARARGRAEGYLPVSPAWHDDGDRSLELTEVVLCFRISWMMNVMEQVPTPRHKYPDRSPDLTEISLRFLRTDDAEQVPKQGARTPARGVGGDSVLAGIPKHQRDAAAGPAPAARCCWLGVAGGVDGG
jgi:hypothetical protein